METKEKKPTPSVKFQWYRKIVSAKDWKDKYQYSSYCILNIRKDGATVKEYEFAYMSVLPTTDLQINDYDELNKIDKFLRARNCMPFALEDVKVNKEIDVKTLF